MLEELLWDRSDEKDVVWIFPDLAVFNKGLCNGYVCAFVVGKKEIMKRAGDLETQRTFENILLNETIRRGVYIPKNHVWFISYSHTEEDIDRTLEVLETGLGKIKEIFLR